MKNKELQDNIMLMPTVVNNYKKYQYLNLSISMYC